MQLAHSVVTSCLVTFLVVGSVAADPITYLAGDVDEFSSGDPADTVVVGPDLMGWLLRPGGFICNHGCVPLDFDPATQVLNYDFGYTFQNITVPVTGGTLTFRMRGEAGVPNNDRVALQFVSNQGNIVDSFEWSIGLSDLDAFAGGDGTFMQGETTTFVLDLANLPPGSGATEVLSSINATGRLDFYNHDDSAFDFIQLDLECECDGTLIDFEALAHADDGEANHYAAWGGRYREDGFQIVPHTGSVLLQTYGEGPPGHPFYSGSTALHGSDNPLASLASLTVDPGGIVPPSAPPTGHLFSFDLYSPLSVLLTERNDSTVAPTEVVFTGYFPDNSTVSQTFTLDDVLATNELFFLSGFHGVKYVDWSLEHQIDAVCIRNACEDGLDNDGDGLIDTADPECVGPDDVSERFLPPVPAVPSASPRDGVVLSAILLAVGAWMRRRSRSGGLRGPGRA